MTRVCIGIHVHAEPERLLATLEGLRRCPSPSTDLLLLPDGPDAATRAALATLTGLPQLGTAEPLGPPACFNRLAAGSTADVLVLLESGCLVGPGWLDQLLAALDADPRNGLAGPSTNRSWNEQGAFPHCGDAPAGVAATAGEAFRRYGSAWRTLEPLHSLADFCYAVRREVVEAVGAADEGYGLGPCWEMDYNIRAARAGFRGVWACAAYVHRPPFTFRRRRAEAAHFPASKRRYQDKFCALRLRGEAAGYEPHCRGDDCEHFAPPGLIQIHLPLPGDRPASPPEPVVTEAPLVSCIMPTRGRPDYVLQSVRYFQRQDYPARELIILDEDGPDLGERLAGVPGVRYVRLPPGQSIGAKRNRGCELARGSLIAHWDDDDWYAPGRLRAQVEPILRGEADVTGLTMGVLFEVDRWSCWGCTPELHRRLFVLDVHGGTLVYRRSVWERGARYPDRSLAEDAYFLSLAVRRGGRLRRLANDGLFVYIRHGQNSWSFAAGQHVDPAGWVRVDEPPLPGEDRAFYLARRGASAASPPERAEGEPLVSCILPTADRRHFVPQAIRYFLRQDYPERELIVVDDGADPVGDLIPADGRIRYVRLASRHTIGAKRNLACGQARGAVIAHWDDDDWMAPWRLRYQVGALLRQGADVCGLRRLLHYDAGNGRAWEYVYPENQKPWVAGNTFCYLRAFWARNPFPDVNVGEDTRFLWGGPAARVHALPDNGFYVALIHPGNVSPKQVRRPYWQPYPVEKIEDLLGEDGPFYRPRVPASSAPSPGQLAHGRGDPRAFS